MRYVKGMWYVMDSIAVQEGPAEVERLFVNTSRQDALTSTRENATYRARWEVEPGSAAVRDNRRLVGMLAGIDAAGVRPTGAKLQRSKALAAQAQAGNVKLVKGAWNEAWLIHMHHQPDWPHDDTHDASAGAFNETIGQRKARSYQG